MIGTFGNIVFEASADKVLTFAGFVRKGSAVFAEHPVMEGKPRLQHTGSGLEEISFSIRLDSGLGVKPAAELKKLRGVRDAGASKKLILGQDVIGDFVLADLEELWDRIDNRGNLIQAGVNLTLKEYVNGS